MHRRWDYLLPCDPAPELESIFANSPPSGEVTELPHVDCMLRECQRVFIVVQVEFADLRAPLRTYATRHTKVIRTLILMQSAKTLASAHLFVLGGKIAVDPNIITSVEYES